MAGTGRRSIALRRADATAILTTADRAGRIVCVAIGAMLGLGYAVMDSRPIDAGIFWTAGHSPHYYGAVWSISSAYIYPPPLAQLLGLLPWAAFVVPWMVLVFWSLWYATRWASLPVMAISAIAWYLGGPGLLSSILALCAIGNPQIVVAACVVAGFRRPVAYAPAILTKLAPGIGLAWFAFRREWRALGQAIAATAAVVVVSALLAPGAWGDYWRFAVSNWNAPSYIPVVPVPFWARAAMSLLLIAWGARTDRPWTVPIAVGWSAISLYEWSFLTIWIAAIPLLVRSRPSGILLPGAWRPSLSSPTAAPAGARRIVGKVS